MIAGEAIARHLVTGRGVRVTWKDGVIARVEPSDSPVPEDVWIAPALFDLQVNGYAGVDFQQDNLELEQLREAVRALREAGCSRFLLTLITDEWPALMARFRRFRELRARDPGLCSAIAGWHIEGPFLSAEPGYCGTHDRGLMLDPTPERMRELIGTAGGDPVLLTLAPERAGAIRAIEMAVAAGFRVSLGHTNAPADVLQRAVAAGARMFTHLGNGCAADLNRHDNILWRVLDGLDVFPSLIPDGIHVAPALFRLFHRLLPADKVCYTTDAMSAAGAGPGYFSLGKRRLQVGPDGIVKEPGTPYLSGSALCPFDGVLRAARMLGCSWQESWKRFSTAPALAMGLPDGLTEGHPAHFVILQEAEGIPSIRQCVPTIDS